MSSHFKPTGNAVFDYKASFRVRAQGAQQVLFLSGLWLCAIGIAGRCFAIQNEALNSSIKYSPALGAILIASSIAWAFWWRNKLRRDFRRDCS